MQKTLLLIIPALALYSCNKEIPDTVKIPVEVDVYVAGYTSDSANYHYPKFNSYWTDGEHPTYWKNGNPVQLDYGDYRGNNNKKSGMANAIAVSGTNVYVAGFGTLVSYTRNPSPYGVFWKNGIPLDRDSMNLWSTYDLYSLAVSTNDTYMAGWGTSISGYWKNENYITLPGDPSTSSITVSGNDVFVAGIENNVAKYWKNGMPVNLSNSSKDTYTSSIAVSGKDVYVAGGDLVREPGNDIEGVAKYWKNGNPVNLTDGSTGAQANSVAVSETDVYVAGSQWDGNSIQYSDGYLVYHHNPIAKYWKNGKPVNLTDGSKWAEAKFIAVSGTDVYVAGFEGGVAKYWKNSSPVILGDVSKKSEAYCIFLAPK